jgi:hypothetical protein
VFSCIGEPSLKDVEAEKTSLVARGTLAPARVTKKWEVGGKDTQYDLAYAFQVGGRSFEGSGIVGAQEYLKLQPGNTIDIRYLPEDPTKSDFRPDRWLREEYGVGLVGSLVGAAGLLGLLVTAVLDVRRRGLPAAPTTPPSEAHTYRSPIFFYFFSLVFFAAGMFFQVQIISQIVSGEDIPFTTTINGHSTTGAMSPAGKIAFAFFPMVFWGIGLGLFLYSYGYSVTTSDEGILIRKFPHKTFQWRWDEITRAERYVKSGGTQYIVGDKDRKIWVTTVQDNDRLAAELETRLASVMGKT